MVLASVLFGGLILISVVLLMVIYQSKISQRAVLASTLLVMPVMEHPQTLLYSSRVRRHRRATCTESLCLFLISKLSFQITRRSNYYFPGLPVILNHCFRFSILLLTMIMQC